MPTTICPSLEQLHDLLSGALDDRQADACEHHLLACPACLVRARDWRPDDLFSETVETAAEITYSESERAAFGRIIAQARVRCHQASTRSALEATDIGDPAAGLDELLAAFTPAASPDELGRFGTFRIQRILGRGGMGAVFLAFDLTLERLVALKLLLPGRQEPVARERFLREARAMAAVRHDHVVAVFQVGEVDGRPFLAEELLEGETLDARLKRDGRLPVDEAVRIARETALGLAAAHAKGLLHRDIKPANIWLEAGTGRVKILDFGLALAASADAQLTDSGTVMGTPAYMAPEQARGERVDARADLFSLGGVLYRMLTGDPAFSGPTMMSVLTAIATQDPHPPRTVRPEVPPELSALVLRLLAKHRDARPATAADVARELQSIAARLAAPASTAPPRRPVRRLALALAAVAAVVLAVVIVKIRTKDGQEKEVAVQVEGEVESVRSQNDAPQAQPVAAHASPFDSLDPAAIPPEERYDWQPDELVAVLGSHRQRSWEGGMSSVSLSGDGSLALRAGPLLESKLIETATGRELPIPSFRAEFVGISPDGRMLAGKTRDAQLSLFVREGAGWVRRPLASPPPGAFVAQSNDVTFSPDGSRLATSLMHGEIDGRPDVETWVWDVNQNPPKRICELAGRHWPAWSPDGRLLALRTADQRLEILDLSESPPRRHAMIDDVEFPSDFKDVFRFAPHGFLGGGQLAGADAAGRVIVWDLTQAEPRETARIELPELGLQQFGPKIGVRPCPTGRDRMMIFGVLAIQVWGLGMEGWKHEADLAPGDPADPQAVRPLYYITDVCLSRDGRTLANVEHQIQMRLWDVTDDAVRERRPLAPQPVHGFLGHRLLVVSSDGAHLATRSEDNLQVWRLGGPSAERLPVDPQGQHDGPVGFLEDELIAQGDSRQLRWRCGPQRVAPRGDFGPAATFLATGPTLWLGRPLSQEHTFTPDELALWRSDRRPVRQAVKWRAAPEGSYLDAAGLSARFAVSRDERTLVTFDRPRDPALKQVVRIWDRSDDDGPPRERYHLDALALTLHQLALTPDASHLVAADETAGLSVWRLGPDRAERVWTQPKSAYAAAISPDGRHLAAGFGKDVSILTLAGELVAQYPVPFGPLDLAFAPDGRHLLVANSNRTIYVLRLKGDAASEPAAPSL